MLQLKDYELAIVGAAVDELLFGSIVGAVGDGLQVGSVESTFVDS